LLLSTTLQTANRSIPSGDGSPRRRNWRRPRSASCSSAIRATLPASGPSRRAKAPISRRRSGFRFSRPPQSPGETSPSSSCPWGGSSSRRERSPSPHHPRRAASN
jgi:hypothetical protein